MQHQRLPKLPGCGRPATTRIEIYSPRETLHGSLDGSVYTCREHTDPAREAIETAGFTAHTMPMSGPKFCGDGYDFLTNREMRAPDAPADNPGNGPITPEQALTQLIDRDRAKDALLGKIAFQCTDDTLSTSGALNEIKALLVKAGIIDSGSSAVREGGSSPDGMAHPVATPARPVPAANGHGSGTYLAEAWMPLGHHYGPGDLIPTPDPALAGRRDGA